MPKIPNIPIYTKDSDSLIVFIYEMESFSKYDNEIVDTLEKYLNQGTSNVVKIVPMISDKRNFKCVYPVIPNDDIIELIEKASKLEDNDLSNLAKGILRSLKLMKLKD